MAKLQIEVREEGKTTTYSADFTPITEVAKSVADTVGTFLKETFKKETFTRTEEES